jgi:quercetin dioxygenase-like cupin family protein
MGRLTVWSAFFGLMLSGCTGPQDPLISPQGPLAPQGRGELPRPAAPAGVLQGTPPKHAFELDSTGAFSRTTFSGDASGFAVTAQDIIVPAHQQTQAAQFPGAALVQVNAGSGTATIGTASMELHSAQFFAVPAGTSILFNNSKDQELTIRLYLVEARP